MPKTLKSTLFLLVAAALGVSAFGYEIGEAMGDVSFWKTDPVIFLNKHQGTEGFKFTSEAREAADTRRDGAVTYFGLPVYETRLAFGEKGGISRVELALFNRGGTEALEEVALADGKKLRRIKRVEKSMTKDEFEKALGAVRAKLTPKGKKPPKVEKQSLKDTKIRQRVQSWPATDVTGAATLTWNYEVDDNKKFSAPGFIRLSVDGPGSDVSMEKVGKKSVKRTQKKGAAKWVDNVVKESRGDVFIDGVPMVDQGAKGYCAVAASERVLRYFGLDVDEHEIAVAAETSVDGTSTAGMIASVKAIGRKNKLATDVLYGDADKSVEARIANLADEVRQYNKAAKKLKKPLISDDDYIKRSGNMITYSPAAVDAKQDVEVLKELKVNRSGKPQYMKFMKNVRQSVSEGRPLLWGVTLGMYPEADLPQAKGGHMRLIIGYNDKKGEILYSDSWGKGHELKRMPADWAWTITHSLIGLRPLN